MGEGEKGSKIYCSTIIPAKLLEYYILNRITIGNTLHNYMFKVTRNRRKLCPPLYLIGHF